MTAPVAQRYWPPTLRWTTTISAPRRRGRAPTSEAAGTSCQKRFSGRAMCGARRLSPWSWGGVASAAPAGASPAAAAAGGFSVGVFSEGLGWAAEGGVPEPKPRLVTMVAKRLTEEAGLEVFGGGGAVSSSVLAREGRRSLGVVLGEEGALKVERAAASQSRRIDWPASRSATRRLSDWFSSRRRVASRRRRSLSARSCCRSSIISWEVSSSFFWGAASRLTSTTLGACCCCCSARARLASSIARSFCCMASSWFSSLACSLASARATT
mmetsp:Transcript_20371/g.64005  ORF Transcript_20371/g.64005 Transcript_20371/m.64005 type:complete len:269 (+) Transcript_20371:988-1794(+)